MKKGKLKELVAVYGKVALATYIGIALLVGGCVLVAVLLGFEVDGTAAQASTAAATYVGFKLTQPFRIAGTVALTPVVARLVGRKAKQPEPSDAPDGTGEDGEKYPTG